MRRDKPAAHWMLTFVGMTVVVPAVHYNVTSRRYDELELSISQKNTPDFDLKQIGYITDSSQLHGRGRAHAAAFGIINRPAGHRRGNPRFFPPA